jgi:hypothetical protein
MNGSEDAAYWNGKAYLFTDKIQTGTAANRLLHELGEHHGLEEMLGPEAYAKLQRQVRNLNKAGNPAVREAWAHVRENYDHAEGSPEFMSEVLARIGDDARVQKMTFWRQVMDAVRAFLAKLGVDVKSDEDVRTLLRASLARVMRQAERERPVFYGRAAQASKFSRPAVAGSNTLGDYRDALSGGALNFIRDLIQSDQKFNWWHRTVGTQQHKALTNREFRGVYDESQAFLSDVSKYANEAADAARDLLPRVDTFADFGRKSPSKADVQAVVDAVYAGTLWGGGSPMDGRTWTDEELKDGRARDNDVAFQAFKGLTEPQVKLYRQTLESIGKSLDSLGKSLIHRIVRPHDIGFDREQGIEDVADYVRQQIDAAIDDRRLQLEAAQEDSGAGQRIRDEIQALQNTRQAVVDIEQKTTALKDKGYFPAMRFGRFAVHVVETVGKEKVQRYFATFESQTKANFAARELAKEFPKADIQKGLLSKEQYRLFQGLSLDALETFADYITDENGQPISKDPLVQGFLKAAVSERSALKRHIHRKGLAGFSDDLPRVLASFTVSSARATSSNYHMSEMLRRANNIKSGDVKDEAIKLVTYLRDPVEEAQALRGFLFAQFLGGSIAHGLVNMTQPFMVTAPYLAQHTSFADAMKKLGEAAISKPEKLTGKIRAAYDKAKAAGVVAPQEIHQLRAETGGMPLGRSLALRKFSFLWGSIYSVTEAFNRTTSFLAAYRIAEEKGISDPYQFAVDTVNETQFVYNKGNRPNWARGPVGATVFTFKQFSIAYLELAKRLYGKDKKAFALMALTLIAAAGMEGLPFAEDIEDLIDTLGQWMGYATNSKKKLRVWAENILGKDLAQVALHGISGVPWMPVDVSNRMGFQNLIPGTGMLKLSEQNKAKDVLELVGPIGQFVPTEDTMMGKAIERISKGDYFGAVKSAAPVSIQNIAKGAEMYASGVAKDTKGKKITEVSPGEAVLKMAGLQPAGVARESGAVSEVMQDINLQKRMESEIAERWARGLVDQDNGEVRAAVRDMMAWNKENPESRIRIGMEQIRRRVKEMRMGRTERVVKSAPPEIRGEVARALR